MLMRDRVMNQNWRAILPRMIAKVDEKDWQRWVGLKQFITAAPVFNIANVAEYLYTGTPQVDWNVMSDFPRPIPLFHHTWMEWPVPAFSLDGEELAKVEMRDTHQRIGCFFLSFEPEETQRGVKQRVVATMFQETVDKKIELTGSLLFHVSDEWKFSEVRTTIPGVADESIQAVPGLEKCARESAECMIVTLYPALLALSLLNCKNVGTIKKETPPRVVKAGLRRGRAVTKEHYEIKIDLIRKDIAASTGQSGYSRNAAAIVRGHFKDYQQGKGLFGRHKGLFWFDQRVNVPNPGSAAYDIGSTGGIPEATVSLYQDAR